MSDIFISYKREEQAEARKLAKALEKQGWSIWWDPKLRAGEHFDDVIEAALKEARCVIVIWSRLSVGSRYVKDEATYALNRRKLVPVAIEEVELPFKFEGIHTPRLIDWDGSDNSHEFRKLLEDIVRIAQPLPIETSEESAFETEPKEIEVPEPDGTEPEALDSGIEGSKSVKQETEQHGTAVDDSSDSPEKPGSKEPSIVLSWLERWIKKLKIKLPIGLGLACLILVAAVLMTEKEIPTPTTIPYNGKSGFFADDRDGKKYKWIRIGGQIWMAENLAYLPRVQDGFSHYYYLKNNIMNPDFRGYNYYKHDIKNLNKYGCLYTWSAATNKENSTLSNMPLRGICPVGWHVPSDSEWKVLEQFLGMSANDIGRIGYRGADEALHIKSQTGWSRKSNGSNSTGFTALPNGYYNGSFSNIENIASFWTSTEYDAFRAWARYLHYDDYQIDRINDQKFGALAVRCVKD